MSIINNNVSAVMQMNKHERVKTLITAKNVINLFTGPDTDSELASQSILGERLQVEKEESGFVYVLAEDLYKGWADRRHLVDDTDFGEDYGIITVASLLADLYSEPDANSEIVSKLVISTKAILVTGSEEHSEFSAVQLPGGLVAWIKRSDIFSGEKPVLIDRWLACSEEDRRQLIKELGVKVVNHAKRFIGVPYLWGGCTPFGIDCSGLVQLVFRLEGLQLLRDADIQFADQRFQKIEEGKIFAEAQLEPGDLVVFAKNKSIVHIGIAMGDGRFIHSSGRLRNFGTYIDTCDEPYWSSIYAGAVRLSPGATLMHNI